MTTIIDRFTLRRGTAADLASVNEVPLAQEIVIESDGAGRATGDFKLKIGDGSTPYNSLPYFHCGTVDSIVEGTNITVDNTDPRNPIVSATGGGGGGGGYTPPGYVIGAGTDTYLAYVMALLPLALPNRSIAFLDLVGNPVTDCAGVYGDSANQRYGHNTLKNVSGGVTLFSQASGLAAGNSGVIIGTQDFCWEIDFKAAGTLAAYNSLMGNRPTSGATTGTATVGINSAGQLYAYANSAFVISPTSATLVSTPTSWHKIAYSVTSGTARLFLDGVLIGTGTQPTVSYTSRISLGADYNGTEVFVGNLANFRYTLGQSRYTASYTPLTTNFPFA